METLYFTSPNEDGTAILRGHPSHAKVQPAGQRKYLHFSVIFKILSIGPAAGIEPATFRSAIKRSTDWANPAAVKKYFHSLFGTYNRRQNCWRCFLLQEAKAHREKELKKAEEDLNKAKKKAEESTKSMKEKQQVVYWD